MRGMRTRRSAGAFHESHRDRARACGVPRAPPCGCAQGAPPRGRLSQRQLGELVGLSQPEINRLEAGRGANAGLDTWAACGAALGMQLAAFLEQASGADQPRDLEHLRRQNLVIASRGRRVAGAPSPRPPSLPMVRYPRSIDVLLLRRVRHEAAIVEVWDLITDGGAAMRGLEVKVRATRERLGASWRVQGLLVVRGYRTEPRARRRPAAPIRFEVSRILAGLARRTGEPRRALCLRPTVWRGPTSPARRLIAARLRA